MKRTLFVLSLAAGIASVAVAKDYLLVGNSATASRGATLHSVDNGDLAQPGLYLNMGATGSGGTTPIEPIQVNNEIWVTDQVADRIDIFNLVGVFKRSITGGMDNIRGLAFANNTVYVANDGTGNGAPADSIVMFDASGLPLGNFPVTGSSPFDIYDDGGSLLITDSTTHEIRRYSYAGVDQGLFHAGAIRFPQQIHRRTNGNYLIAGFSPPSAVYEYDSSGTQLATYAAGFGGRSGFELGNGDLLVTKGDGVFRAAAFTGSLVSVMTGAGRYINVIEIPVIEGVAQLGDYTAPIGDVPITIEILEAGTSNLVESYTFNADSGTGAYAVNTSLAPGTYDVAFKASHWLRKVVAGVQTDRDGALAPVSFSLINGDVDGDNEVGPGDFGLLASAFLSVNGDPNWNANADLDGDGEVGPGDFSILANNFLSAGD